LETITKSKIKKIVENWLNESLFEQNSFELESNLLEKLKNNLSVKTEITFFETSESGVEGEITTQDNEKINFVVSFNNVIIN